MPDSSNRPASNETATGVVTVPAAPALLPSQFDDWGSVKIVIGGIVALIIASNAIMSLVKGIIEFLEKKRAGDKEKISPLEVRMKSLEDTSKNFRDSAYLDREFSRLEEKINHEKGNSQGARDALSQHIRAIESKLSDEMQSRIRMEARIDNIASNTQRVETAVELLRERLEERFDRFQELLTTIHKA